MWDLKELEAIATEAWSCSLDEGIINSAKWSPDGSLVVANCFKDFLVILDGRTGEEVTRLERLEYSRSESFWSSDGSLLFSNIHEAIRVWDTLTWKEVRRFDISRSFHDSLAVDSQGMILAVGHAIASGLHGHGRVDLWRAADGLRIGRVETKAPVAGVSLSGSGQLATWSNGGPVKIWDWGQENSIVRTLPIEKGTPTQVIWSPSGSSIVVVTNASQLYVFDAESGERRYLRDSTVDVGFVVSVNGLEFSSDESWLASRCTLGKVLLWRTSDWTPFATFRTRSRLGWRGTPPLLAIKPDAPVILTPNDDCSGLIAWRLGDLALASLSTEGTPTTEEPRAEQSNRMEVSKTTSEGTPEEPRVISLGELERLGEFTRWQEVRERLRVAEQERGPLRNYPLFSGWSAPDSDIDVFDGSLWKRVAFRDRKETQITYEHGGATEQLVFHRNTVAPAGHFTDFREDEFHISHAELSTEATFPDGHWQVVSSELVHVKWPYLTLRVTQRPPDAIVARASSVGTYIFHVADPRLIVNGETRPPPLFNSPIAVSHRWHDDDHPDRSGAQYRELTDRAKRLRLHPSQPFLIDYCSLPQKPWTPEEEQTFVGNLLPFHKAFSRSSIIIHNGAEDYGTRAWCVLELMLIAVEGHLADGRGKLRGTPELPTGLQQTWKEAENYLQLSNETRRNFANAVNAARANAWPAYVANDRNMAFQNAKENQQRALLRRFDKELNVRHQPDRRHIKRILRELVFRDGPF